MAEKFNDMAGRLKDSPWLWVFFMLFILLFIISAGLFVEDFTTSLLGYQEWPTAKANDWVIFLVALLPQVGQVSFAYAYIDKRQPEMLLILGLFFLWDLSTDVYYKSYRFRDTTITAMALFESLPLYTLGSEILMAFSLGMIRSTWLVLKSRSSTHRYDTIIRQNVIPKQNITPVPPPPSVPTDRIFTTRPTKKE